MGATTTISTVQGAVVGKQQAGFGLQGGCSFCWWLKSGEKASWGKRSSNPTIYRVLYIPGGFSGLQPSIVGTFGVCNWEQTGEPLGNHRKTKKMIRIPPFAHSTLKNPNNTTDNRKNPRPFLRSWFFWTTSSSTLRFSTKKKHMDSWESKGDSRTRDKALIRPN